MEKIYSVEDLKRIKEDIENGKSYVFISYSNGMFKLGDYFHVTLSELTTDEKSVLIDCTNAIKTQLTEKQFSGNNVNKVSAEGRLYILCEEKAANKLIEFQEEYYKRIDAASKKLSRAYGYEINNIITSANDLVDPSEKEYKKIIEEYNIDLENYILSNLVGKVLPIASICFDDFYTYSDEKGRDRVNWRAAHGFIDVAKFSNMVKGKGYTIESKGETIDISDPIKYLLKISKNKFIDSDIEVAVYFNKKKEHSKKKELKPKSE